MYTACGIQSVVNFEVEVPEDVAVLHSIHVEDEGNANLLDHLEDAIKFIDDAVGLDGKVLVSLSGFHDEHVCSLFRHPAASRKENSRFQFTLSTSCRLMAT